jgi:hypothetical protein
MLGRARLFGRGARDVSLALVVLVVAVATYRRRIGVTRYAGGRQ